MILHATFGCAKHGTKGFSTPESSLIQTGLPECAKVPVLSASCVGRAQLMMSARCTSPTFLPNAIVVMGVRREFLSLEAGYHSISCRPWQTKCSHILGYASRMFSGPRS